ncbi:MAG: DUF5060 domain-containing protein [Verrucomicrobiota bacterium]
MGSVSKAQVLFEETDGFVLIEAEAAPEVSPTSKAWSLYTNEPVIDPFDRSQSEGPYYRNDGVHGGAYIVGRLDRTLKVVEGRLNYEFKINTPGLYCFVMRSNMQVPHSHHDTANDVWFRVQGRYGTPTPKMVTEGLGHSWETWYKAYTVNWPRRQTNPQEQFTNIWHWEGKAPTDKRLVYEFEEEGTYRIQLSVRSKKFALDTLGFYRLEDAADAADTPSYNFLNSFAFARSKGAQHQLDQLRYSNVAVNVTGELKQWHKTTLDIEGPEATEGDDPNPFMDYRMTVTFTNGSETIVVPGYFAADGDAANTSATSGNIWRAHFTPTTTGTWNYEVDFRSGSGVALATGGTELTPYDGVKGSFDIEASDKTGKDFRAPDKGKLVYTGKAYPEWMGGAGVFLKAEANSTELLLTYTEFDGTNGESRDYRDHVQDWVSGDPTWTVNQEGKGIIGLVNYLTDLGVNCHYALMNNIEGDGKKSFPFTGHWKSLNSTQVSPVVLEFPDALMDYDVSKLEQWQKLFDHMMSKGMMMHMVLSEQENQSFFEYHENQAKPVGDPEITFAETRKLYYRELVARFGYLNAVTWNIGEENSWQTNGTFGLANDETDQIAFASYLHNLLPYKDDQIVIHNPINGPGEAIFTNLLGDAPFTGVSYQGIYTDPSYGHDSISHWRTQSEASGRPWVVSYDEPYAGEQYPSIGSWRKNVVWASLTAGSAGVGFYNNKDVTGFKDDYSIYASYYTLMAEAIEFMSAHLTDLNAMSPNNALVDPGNYSLADEGNQYLIYLPSGGTTNLDLSEETGSYRVQWFDPRNGGSLQDGTVQWIYGGTTASLGAPPANTSSDWVILVEKGIGPPNVPPAFASDPILVSDASEDMAYTDTIATSATDADGDTLTYSKVSGSAWLDIAADGTLSGTPTSGDLGVNYFTVMVADGQGGTDEAQLNIAVVAAQDLISIDFDTTKTGSVNTYSGSGITPGNANMVPLPGQSSLWNSLTVGPGDARSLKTNPTFSNLLDGKGQATSVQFELNYEGLVYRTWEDSNTPDILGRDVIYTQYGIAGRNVKWRFNGLRPDTQYTIRVFGQVSGSGGWASNRGNFAVPVNGSLIPMSSQNYMDFTVLSDSQGQITGRLHSDGDIDAMSGVQITSSIASAFNYQPSFSEGLITATGASGGSAYSGTVAGTASDVDGDVLSYNKVSGPDWLNVAADGTLSGTPTNGDAGNNVFIIEASDGQGGLAEVQLEIDVTEVTDLISIDFDTTKTGGVNTYSGSGTTPGNAAMEPIAGQDGTWNSLVVGPGDALSQTSSPTLDNLIDGKGNTTSVQFELNYDGKIYRTWEDTSATDSLGCDVVYTQLGVAGRNLRWRFSGLNPDTEYTIRIFGQVAGNGNYAGNRGYFSVPANNELIRMPRENYMDFTYTSNSEGEITGQLQSDGGVDAVSGLQIISSEFLEPVNPIFVSTVPEVSSESRLAYSPFDVDVADSDENLTLSLEGGASVLEDIGIFAGSVRLNGVGDVIAIDDHADLNNGNAPFTERTVSLWFAVDEVTGRQMIYEEGGNVRGLNIYLDGDTLYVGGWDKNLDGEDTAIWEGTWRTVSGIVANQWYHVALVLDATENPLAPAAGQFFAYLDGVEFDADNSVGMQLSDHIDNVGIGGVVDNSQYASGTKPENLAGYVDDFAIWNRALTPAEIATLAGY